MGTLVFLVYGGLFAALTVRHFSYALVALICMFAYEQWGGINLAYVAQNGSVVNLALILLALIGWFRLPPGSSLEHFMYPVRVAITLLLLYAFISTLWAPTDARATGRFMDGVHYLIVVVAIAPLLVMKPENVTRVLDVVTTVGGLLVILFAYVPSFEGRGIVYEYDFEETLSLPLTLGTFAGSVMIISMVRLRGGLLPTLWALVVSGSAIFLIVKTGSRGQLIFSLAALMFCLPARWKRLSLNKVMIYVLLGLMAAGAFLVVLNTENTLSARIRNADQSTQTRVEMISILMEAWSAGGPEVLIFGLGSSASWSQELVQFYPHVVPLEVLGELGFVGFALFSWIVLSLFMKAYSGQVKSQLPQQTLNDYSALFGCFVFALLISCKQGTLIYSTDLFMYAALAEKTFVLGGKALQDRAASASRRRRFRRSMLQRT